MSNEAKSNEHNFKLIFDQIIQFKVENPDFHFHIVENDTDLEFRTIKEFGEICEEIAAISSRQAVYTTFC